MKEPSIFKLTPAQIGISSRRWHYANHRWTKDRALARMQQMQYDILPIKSASGEFVEFYVTDAWGKLSAEHVIIKSHKQLPVLESSTRFMELLGYFEDNDHKYALLVNNGSVAGLISVVNFSCNLIYKRLYEYVADFEIKLTNYLFKTAGQDKIWEALIKNNSSRNKEETLGKYLIDRERNMHGELKEYFYLSTLLNLVTELKLFDKMGYDSRTSYEKATSKLAEIRNNIAHPVRSMIRTSEDFARLKTSLEAMKTIAAAINKP